MKLLTATGMVLLAAALAYLALGIDYALSVPSDPAVFIALGLLALAVASFILARTRIPRRLTVLVMITFIVVGVFAPIIWSLNTTTVGCSGTCGEYRPTLTIKGEITMPPGSANGTMAVQVINSGANNSAILGLTVTDLGPDYGGPIPNNNVISVAMIYQSNLVSSSNPLLQGGTATASLGVPNVVTGASYTIFVSYVYANQGAGGESYDVPTQSVPYNSTNTIELSVADGSTVCPDLLSGNGNASWNPGTNTCTLSPGNLSPTLCIAMESGGCATHPAARLLIDDGTTLAVASGAQLSVFSTLDNYGIINATVGAPVLEVYGVINNYGTIAARELDILPFNGPGFVNNFNGTIINTYSMSDFGRIVNYGTIVNEGHIAECTQTNEALFCGTIQGTGKVTCLDSCSIQTTTTRTQAPNSTTSTT